MTTALSIDGALGRLFADAELRARSGIVNCKRGKLKRIFCVLDGRLAFARSNVIEEQITEVLVERRLVPVGKMSAIRRKAEQESADPLSLLVSSGIVTADALRGWLVTHITEMFTDTMRWDDGEVEWVIGLPDLEGEFTVEIELVSLVRDYALAQPSITRKMRAAVGAPAATLQYDGDRARLLGGFAAEPLTAHCLAAADGQTPIESVVKSAPASEERCWAVLYALSLLGCVAPCALAQSDSDSREALLARIRRAERTDHYSLLDIQPTASGDQVRAAYYRLARDYHPDRYRAGALADMLQQVEGYFAKVTAAYNTLIHSELRKAYDLELRADTSQKPEQDTAFLAQQNFRAALKLATRGRLNDALKALDNAVKLDSRNALYRLELGKLLGKNPRLREEAERQLLEANQLDPSLIEGYVALGELYARSNRVEEAIRAYREALNWEPGHLAATQALAALEA